MGNFCPKCGNRVYQDSIFCEYCGNKLKSYESPTDNVQFVSAEPTRRPVSTSTPRVFPQRSSTYYYTPHNKSSSSGIKWMFIAIFFVIIIGFAAVATLFGFISIISFSRDYGNQYHRSTDEVDFRLIDYSLISSQPGIQELTVTIQNSGGAAAISRSVPISWEDNFFEMQLSDGVGVLNENVVGIDLNGDKDILDTFIVTWYRDNNRQWDAIIKDGLEEVHAYSIFEGSAENPGRIRTYYINGNPKLFQLGNQSHSLYMANNDYALFGLGNAVILHHSGPCFEVIIDSTIIATEFKVNENISSLDYTRTFADNVISDPWFAAAYIVPISASEVESGEYVTFSCTLISNASITSDIFLYVNWSPDGYTRKIWLPFEQSNIVFEAINIPYFVNVNSSLVQIEAGFKQLISTVKNIGASTTVGTVPISWEKMIYNLPLDNGEGILEEYIIDLDLNGDGDKMDSFDVSWFSNDTRHLDAIINDDIGVIHAYSLWETPIDDSNAYRTYYIDGKPKIFQLGSDSHSLYYANNDIAVFGLGEAQIINHPNPNFDLVIEYPGLTSSVEASNFKINQANAQLNYTWNELWSSQGVFPWTIQAWIVSNQTCKISSGEEVTFSCTLATTQTITCNIYMVLNWSPDGNTRIRWIPFMETGVFFEI